MCMLVIDMNTDTCNISSLRYSSSCTTSVTTTRPSHGEKTSSLSCILTRCGSRKNAAMKNQNSSRNMVPNHMNPVRVSMQKYTNNQPARHISPVMPMILYPSLFIFISSKF